jgi:hypothetical protein
MDCHDVAKKPTPIATILNHQIHVEQGCKVIKNHLSFNSSKWFASITSSSLASSKFPLPQKNLPHYFQPMIGILSMHFYANFYKS